jgi:drug/metabolite transporter (DMT)-like permease
MAGLIRSIPHIDSYTVAFFRFAICLALLGSLALTKKIELTFGRSTLLFLRGLFGGMAVLLFYLAINTIGIAKGTVILYSSPIFATIGGVIFLGEKVSTQKWFIIFAAFFGIYLIATGDAKGLLSVGMYDLLAALGAVSAGVAVVLVKKLRSTESSHSIFFAQSVVGIWMVLIPTTAATSSIGIGAGFVLFAIGIAASAGQLSMTYASAGQLSMTYAFRHLPISTGSLIGMLVPVFNIGVGVIGFGEVISLRCITGILIVLVSCALVLAGKRDSHPSVAG